MKQNALPISIREFADALFKRPCQVPYRYDQRGHRTLVSGGVDSMALAALCMQMKNNYIPFASDGYPIHLNKIDFRAIIVNHGVRDGSLEEAQKVMKVLESLGMTGRILTLPWNDVTGNPSKLPNFESLARKYRFQAIGKYCQKSDINSLLLGHHSDDQAETVVMRLAKGALGAGLLGIKPSSPIPECGGLYGVHESGSPITLSPPITNLNRQTKPLPSRQTGQNNIDSPASGAKNIMPELKVESGGITLYRPLLEFPKERLIATCKALGMEWFEDDTNNDPTLTDRNAIRYLYDRTGLPSILPKSRVLSLAAQFQNADNLRQQEVDQLIKKCKVTSFSTRRGTLIIRFPFIAHDAPQRSTIAAMLLRRIIMTVTPNSVVSLEQALKAVPEIFPLSENEIAPKIFNTAGVLFQPINVDPKIGGSNEWHIFRQPRYRYSPDEIVVPELLPEKQPSWVLFDNRYWLSIHNELASQAGSLVVRFLNEDDISKLGKALNEKGSWILKRLLRAVEGEMRWIYSLPVVVWRPHGGVIVGQEVIVGLPTLGVRVDGFNRVKWLCRYKKINLTDVGLQAAFKPESFRVRRVMGLKGEVSDEPKFAPWLSKREKLLTGLGRVSS
ncbi:hypothetical protein sscle_15g103700 [Sclerotinia sclerotiorum 1980 UF-70]|uniref:tRNA(Ile)-lysidine synthetase n=1 Tax=Sclerotinia sclerotiorum (strain ATCC 18683 / 1980 / Ss-1) TaxID=665079 RepID=A0A1D9QKY2_SCLS1|nr:hypothetical protein sscle_15g103700 [Sclerotinia sclerotiorum 1980 UF-70]